MSSKSQLTYSARASNHPNALAKRLFQIAETKKTNVTVSADVTTTKELLDLADRTLFCFLGHAIAKAERDAMLGKVNPN